jgi:isopenicillin N synthase-like dioxygenase
MISLPSNFHRVKNPEAHEYQGARYSLAFFCQANEDVLIESPKRNIQQSRQRNI